MVRQIIPLGIKNIDNIRDNICMFISLYSNMWLLHGTWMLGHHKLQRFDAFTCAYMYIFLLESMFSLTQQYVKYIAPDFSLRPVNIFYFSFLFFQCFCVFYIFFCHFTCKDSVSLDLFLHQDEVHLWFYCRCQTPQKAVLVQNLIVSLDKCC